MSKTNFVDKDIHKLVRYGKIHIYKSLEDSMNPFVRPWKIYSYDKFVDMIPLFQKEGESDYDYVMRCCSSWRRFFSHHGSDSVAIFDDLSIAQEKKRQEDKIRAQNKPTTSATLGDILKAKRKK